MIPIFCFVALKRSATIALVTIVLTITPPDLEFQTFRLSYNIREILITLQLAIMEEKTICDTVVIYSISYLLTRKIFL